MKLSTPRYALAVFCQLIFVSFDIICNCLSLFPRGRDGLLLLFLFQDLFLILAFTILLVTFLSTYVFQAGLVEVLIRKFRAAVSVIGAYIVASIVLHAVWLLEKWGNPEATSSPVLIVLITIQRCLSPWYYFFYKRAALRVSDPRFYEDIDWINRQLQSR